MKTVAGALLLVVAVTANAQTFRQVEPNGQVCYDKPALQLDADEGGKSAASD